MNDEPPRVPTGLERALLEWSLGLRHNESLPVAACAALELGDDSRGLRQLAGLIGLPADQLAWELPPLVEQVHTELELPLATKEDAMRRLALACAKRIVDREIQPREGRN